MTRLAAPLALVFLLASTEPAFAQSTAAAETLFNEGRIAMDAKDFDTACTRFRESNRLDPAAGTVLNLAVCEQQRGRLATAWELFRAAYEKLPGSDPRRDYVQTQLSQIEPRLPKVTLTLAADAPPDTRVKDGDTEYSGAAFGIALPMDPGKHALVVDAPNREARSIELDLAEASNQTVEVSPGAPKPDGAGEDDASGGGAGTAGDTGKAGSKGRDTRLIGFIAGGVGVVGLGIGATTGLMALGKKSTTDKECSDALKVCSPAGRDAADAGSTLATVSTVGWIVGVLGVGAGAYFILTSDSGSETAVVTETLPGGAGVRVSHRF